MPAINNVNVINTKSNTFRLNIYDINPAPIIVKATSIIAMSNNL